MISILILFSLLTASYFGFINTKILFLILVIVYWLPKCLFIKSLEFYYPSVWTRFPNADSIALTIDDVPFDYNSFSEILAVLKKYQVKVTFFVVSDIEDDRNYELLVEAVRQGHQLANHGRTNSLHWWKTQTELIHEINHCQNLLTKIYQDANVPMPTKMLYRPGAGMFDTSMLQLVNNKGYELVLGSVQPSDPFIIFGWINYLYLTLHVEKGDIVVLHDRSWTAPMLEKFLPWLIKNKLKSVTLENLSQNC